MAKRKSSARKPCPSKAQVKFTHKRAQQLEVEAAAFFGKVTGRAETVAFQKASVRALGRD